MFAPRPPAGFSLVVAADRNRGIGQKGQLPWKLSGDMRFFRELTRCPDSEAVKRRYGLVLGEPKTGKTISSEDLFKSFKAAPALPESFPEKRNAVLMGRHTWESLPEAFRPLPGRFNGVLSRRGTLGEAPGYEEPKVWASLRQAVAELQRDETLHNIFVIGGAQVFEEALSLPECESIYLTSLDADFPCDVFLPEISSAFREVAASNFIEEQDVRFRFRLLQRDIE